MPDRDKVLNGLECCADGTCCGSCPYDKGAALMTTCTGDLSKDALELLKEQDTVEHALSVLWAAGWKENPMMDELIVRCKDCREIYYASNRAPSERAWVCGLHGIDVKPEWHCADGERRTP